MTSFYIGPDRPRISLADWLQVVAAVQTGVTAETQWCELKADVPASSPAANTELAKDLASLTVDGGVLLIGVRDRGSEAADVVGVDDSTLPGLTSRIDQVAGSRITPAMHLTLHELPDPAGSGRTVLVIAVPASEAAPHMVDNVYLGRSATGKRPLSDEDVARLMSARAGRQERFVADLQAMSDTVDLLPFEQRTRGRLYILAQPVTAVPVELSSAVGGKHMLELLIPLIETLQPTWATSFRYLGQPINHPDGLAAANWPQESWTSEYEDNLAFLQLRDDGAVMFASGDAIRLYGEDGPPAINLPAVCEALTQVAALTGHMSEQYLRYGGQWRLGVHISGLRGLFPSQRYWQSFGTHRLTDYAADNYTASAVMPAAQLSDPSSATVEPVLTRLARGLGLRNAVFPYGHISQLPGKLGV